VSLLEGLSSVVEVVREEEAEPDGLKEEGERNKKKISGELSAATSIPERNSRC